MTLPHPHEVETNQLRRNAEPPVEALDIPGRARKLVQVVDDHTIQIAGVVLITPMEPTATRASSIAPIAGDARDTPARGFDPRRLGSPDAMGSDPHRTTQRFRDAIAARFLERRPNADGATWQIFVDRIRSRLRTYDTADQQVMKMIIEAIDGL